MLVREPNKYLTLNAQHRELCAQLKDHLQKTNRMTDLKTQMDYVEHMHKCDSFEQWKRLVKQLKSVHT